MLKLIYIVLLALPVLVFGATSADTTATFNFVIPEIVAIDISNTDIVWDFSTMTGFDPANLPDTLAPTSPAAPHQQIDYLVWGLDGSTTWNLTVKGDADPGNGILLGDILYGESDASGTQPTSWTPFSTSEAEIQPASASTDENTNGWETTYQNYRVVIDGDETHTTGSSCTVTYTVQTL